MFKIVGINLSENITEMVIKNNRSLNYISGQIDRLQEMYLENLIDFGLEEARADTFAWKALSETEIRPFMKLGRLEDVRTSDYIFSGSMDDLSRKLANAFNLSVNRLGGENLITDKLVQEASYRSRAAYLATVGYDDLEYVMDPIRRTYFNSTTFARGVSARPVSRKRRGTVCG